MEYSLTVYSLPVYSRMGYLRFPIIGYSHLDPLTGYCQNLLTGASGIKWADGLFSEWAIHTWSARVLWMIHSWVIHVWMIHYG